MLLRAVLLSRCVVAIGLYRGNAATPYLVRTGSYVGVRNRVINPWTYFDSEQFLDLARLGYDRVRVAFFPLYPTLLRLGGKSDVSRAAFGIAISSAAFLAGLWFVYQWVLADASVTMARRVVWLLAFFPTSVVWTSLYSESLFFMMFAGMLWSLRTERFAIATAFGLLAGATRNTGLVLAGALVLALLVGRVRSQRRLRWQEIMASASPLIAFLIFEGWVAHRFGLSAPRQAQELFSRQLHQPAWAIWQDLRSLNHPSFLALLNLVGVALGLALAGRALLKGRIVGFVIITGVLAMHLTFPTLNVPHTNGAVRYLMPLIPFHYEMADLIEHRFATVKSPAVRSAAMISWSLLATYVALSVGHKYFAVG